jgi:hypothetical protein
VEASSETVCGCPIDYESNDLSEHGEE